MNQPVVTDSVGEAPVQVKPETSVDTSDWKTYRNEEYGFEMKYPKEYVIFDDYQNRKTLFLSFPENKVHRVEGIFLRLSDEALTPEGVLQQIKKNNVVGGMDRLISDESVTVGEDILARKIVHTAEIGYNPEHYFFDVNGYRAEIEIRIAMPFTEEILKTVVIRGSN